MLPQRNRPSPPTHCNQILWIVLVFLWLELGLTLRPTQAERLIGYTELHTNLPGGRHANVRTRRAAVMRLDGTDRRLVAPQLVDKPDAWTQFAGWSPDGQQAVIYRGWQDPHNARWEEEHRRFRMLPGKWMRSWSISEQGRHPPLPRWNGSAITTEVCFSCPVENSWGSRH